MDYPAFRFPQFIKVALAACALIPVIAANAQVWGKEAAAGAGLWRSAPDYPVPYGILSQDSIKAKLRLVAQYVDDNCPVRWVDLDTKEPIAAGGKDVAHPGLEYGLFAPVSYEWGVTYAAMLRAGEVTGDPFYTDYVRERLEAIGQLGAHYLALPEDQRPRMWVGMRLVEPHSLDSCGSMTAALLKAKAAGIDPHLDALIGPAMRYISTGQKRLADGTLARDRPLPDSLWLDDLYMSVPALAQMGRATGELRYFDDACAQLLNMTERMYVPALGLYRHGWVQGMETHPTFAWGRANGWTIMAAAELLSVLPADHPQYAKILAIYRQHIEGIARYQGIDGFWHQLVDRPETYEETSATAMFVFALARGINRGWIDASAYGPRAIAGWNALSTRIDATGAVEGTCVGTGMGWDPTFYAYRPVSPYAAHGYGPVILAGAEMLEMLHSLGDEAKLHDSAVHIGKTPNW